MAQETGGAGEPGDQKKSGRGFSATTVFAVFGFMTALVSFVFLVNPAWRPDPRENQTAKLSVAALDRGIPWGAYVASVGRQGLAKTHPGKACLPGNVVYVEETLQGFKHRNATLKFLTMDAASHLRVTSGIASTLTGEVTSDQGVTLQWVGWPKPTPAKPRGRYFIRFELFSAPRRGNLITIADTPAFKVTTKGYNDAVLNCYLAAQGTLNESGYSEASVGGGGGFDVGTWLLWGALAVVIGLLAALAFHGLTRLLRRRQRPSTP